MKNVVFLGSKKIGLSCLKYLNEQSVLLGYNVLGVLTNHRGNEIIDYSKPNNIRIIKDLNELLSIKETIDIMISVQYHQILKKEHIQKAKEIAVNLHMAPLPEYRGCNQFSFAILDNKREFGTTIHRLEEGIDSGDIIFEKRFPVNEDIWVEELYYQTYNASEALFKERLEDLIKGSYKLTPQAEHIESKGTAIHFRKEINSIKVIDLNWPKEKIEKHIRATSFSGFEPPYSLINNKKIYFSETI